MLEVGCGSGQLACLLRDKGLRHYTGVDCRIERIEEARRECPEFEFCAADAFDLEYSSGPSYDAVIADRLLGRVERDLDLLEMIPSGTRLFITVPNFSHERHVRHFEDIRQVRERYGPYLESCDVDFIPGPLDRHYFLLEGIKVRGKLVEHLAERTTALRKREKEVRKLERQLDVLRNSREKERRQLENAHIELGEKREKNAALRDRLSKKKRQIARLSEEVARRSQEVSTLTHWMENLTTMTSALFSSRRWRVGDTLGNLLQRILLRPSTPVAVNSIREINDSFRAWKKEHIGDPSGAGGKPNRRRNSSGKTVAHTSNKSTDSEKARRRKVSVLAWDLCHNPVGRAHLLADVLSRNFDVEIVGAKFPTYGSEVWGPVKDSSIPIVDYGGQDFPTHFREMERVARRIDGDVILVSKPRLPSYELGILAKQFENRPLILDVDDYELSFFQQREGLTLKEAGALQRDREFLVPQAGLWTRYCDGIIPLADALTVSNVELQKRYGGEIVPHARDERTFDANLYDRDSIRQRFGFTPEDRVILFIGTVRPHKGVLEIAQALERIGDSRYKLCIIGSIQNRKLRAQLEGVEGDHVRLFDDQPYQDLPANLVVGDLICLLQDPESEISKYQIPAKFTDALAMSIPMLATNAPPLRHLASRGLVEPLGESSLDQKIEEIFSDYTRYKGRALENRRVFQADFSYAAVAEKLERVIRPLLHEPPPLPKEFKRLVRFHRQAFSSSISRSGEKPEMVRSRSTTQYL